jgi:hypothetical protein
MNTVTAWKCVYCGELIPIKDPYVDPVDHMLDEHRCELIAERPLILHGPRQPVR